MSELGYVVFYVRDLETRSNCSSTPRLRLAYK